MELLQKFYILILNPFCGLSEKINDKMKSALIYIVCFLLYSTCYVWYSIIGMGTPLTLLSRMLQSIVLIIILIFLGLSRPLKVKKWNRLVFYTWFILGALMLVMGFFSEQNTGYWMTGPVIALGLPCFYMVYGEQKKYELIFDAICKAAIICSIIYFFICLYGEFINDNIWVANRYNGLTIDANKIGELCLSSFCCIIYYFLVGNSKKWKIVSLAAMGMLLGQTYLTQSRTTILAMVFILCFYLIIIVKNAVNEKNIRTIINKCGLVAVSLILAVVAVNIINFTHQKHVDSLQQPSSEAVASIQEDSQSDASIETDAGQTDYRKILPEKGADMNSYSSGRLFIWQTYAEGFNFIGNSADAEVPISPLIKQRTAHNSLVEITYRSGYVTGFVYLILEMITGIYILIVMFRKNSKNSNGDYFIAIASIGYIIFTNLMSSFNPLTAIIFLLYAIAFPVLLDKRQSSEPAESKKLA